jgi:Fe-S cluster biogenesis protein NfuA
MLEQEKVESALGEIRKMLQADGGDVEFVKIEENRVHVRLTGACAGCPMRNMTLKNGIEKYLKEKMPELEEVVAV